MSVMRRVSGVRQSQRNTLDRIAAQPNSRASAFRGKNILSLAAKRLVVDPGDGLQLAEKQSARTVSWWEAASPLQAIKNIIVELGELARTHWPSTEASFQHSLLEHDSWQRMAAVSRNPAEGLVDRIRLPLKRLGKKE